MRRKPKKEVKHDEVISPLDFIDFEEDHAGEAQDEKSGSGKTVKKNAPPKKKGKAFFITGTDTSVGKTVVTFVLGMLLKEQKIDVGVMKPVQCGGDDAQRLADSLEIHDSLEDINPYCAKEPLSPHLAFERQKITVDPKKIMQSFEKLRALHDVLLVEGAGGLMVPITEQYLMMDLIKDLDVELIVVARLGLGTINHTLLTVQQARDAGVKVRGIIFNHDRKGKPGVPEKTNPSVIQRLGQCPVLGTIPHLENLEHATALRKCKDSLNLQELMKEAVKDKPKPLASWDKQYLWHPFTQMKDWLGEEPLIIEEARGDFLFDTNGKKYIDGVSSLWVNIHGHRNQAIDQAVRKQLNQLSHSTLLGLSNAPAIELARRLVEITPPGLEKVFYSDNGSTAVEVAIKMAYQYWQNVGKKDKTQIVHLANSYHGDTCGSVSVGGIDLFHKIYRNLVFKTVKVDFPDCYRAPEGKEYPEYAFACLKKMESLFKRQKTRLAALVVEPIVQGAGGMIVWPEGILKKMRELCDTYDVFLIADEVATGFGRTGKMFACEHEEVVPDFLCLAKGITGGYLPLAATLTTKKVFDGFLFDYKEQKTFFHGHTYSGNPLACAAALASIDLFQQRNVIHKLQSRIRYLAEQLKRFYQIEHVGHVRQKGFMVGIELVADKKEKTPYPWDQKMGIKVCEEARRRGVILRPLGNVVVLMPPLAIGKKAMDELLEVTYQSIRAAVGEGGSRRPRQRRYRRRPASQRK